MNELRPADAEDRRFKEYENTVRMSLFNLKPVSVCLRPSQS